jgi:hypothetical protein
MNRLTKVGAVDGEDPGTLGPVHAVYIQEEIPMAGSLKVAVIGQAWEVQLYLVVVIYYQVLYGCYFLIPLLSSTKSG